MLVTFQWNSQGGGWCNNVTTCLDRKNTRLGSSRLMEKQWNFSAILSNNESSNPGSESTGSQSVSISKPINFYYSN